MTSIPKYLVVSYDSDEMRVFGCDSLEEGKDHLYWKYRIRMDYAEHKWKDHKSPSAEEREEWNAMVNHFTCHICCYNADNADYKTCFKLSGEELAEIGWKLFPAEM